MDTVEHSTQHEGTPPAEDVGSAQERARLLGRYGRHFAAGDVETVKRTVLRLRDRQYLRINDERIEIPDVEGLRRLYTLLGAQDELAR